MKQPPVPLPDQPDLPNINFSELFNDPEEQGFFENYGILIVIILQIITAIISWTH